MRYELKHLNGAGTLKTTNGNISLLAFTKHLAFAGAGIYRSPMLAFRYLGYFFEYQQYWGQAPSAFQLPLVFKNDPTETTYVSNRIGRAFADFFAKNIYGARFTHSYEDAMVRNGHKVRGKRPDFYCDNLHQQFAVEAKGFSQSSVSDNEMNCHKAQSQTGPIHVNFSVASAAFNLYKHPKVKFYDPVNDSVEYNTEINLQLRSLYLNRILEMLDVIGIERSRSELNDYYAYDIPLFLFPKYRLLVHRAIAQRDWNDNAWLETVKASPEGNDEYYIDLDGIGLTRR